MDERKMITSELPEAPWRQSFFTIFFFAREMIFWILDRCHCRRFANSYFVKLVLSRGYVILNDDIHFVVVAPNGRMFVDEIWWRRIWERCYTYVLRAFEYLVRQHFSLSLLTLQ